MNKRSITQYYRKHRTAIVTAASGLLYGGGWSLELPHAFRGGECRRPRPATIVGGFDIAKTAYHEVTNRTLGIKTLVTLAAISAIVIGSTGRPQPWSSCSASAATSKAGRCGRPDGPQELLEMTPDTATVRRDGELRRSPPATSRRAKSSS